MAKDTTQTAAAPKPQATTASAPATASAPEAVKPQKREKKAEHTYINASGAVVENIEEATGCGYKDLATGKTFTFQIPGAEPGKVQTMFALFGLKTNLTNTASGNRNSQDGPTTDDVSAIEERFKELKDGQWSIAGEGAAKGPKWDLDILTSVMVELVGKASGKPQDPAKMREKLNDDLKYRRGAMANPQVKMAYQKAAGVSGADLASFAV